MKSFEGQSLHSGGNVSRSFNHQRLDALVCPEFD